MAHAQTRLQARLTWMSSDYTREWLEQAVSANWRKVRTLQSKLGIRCKPSHLFKRTTNGLYKTSGLSRTEWT
ncbi:hypothetical protein [Ephemeroptericola cinctiostellae]|uniref:hypothetical protein n=1 Tax=Ephemeroptericola cinctiostellae TaxID=2268024 RepID=UPI000DF72D7A|nr:hypothetical protein [Ephemeroptericola cinctiostellae]